MSHYLEDQWDDDGEMWTRPSRRAYNAEYNPIYSSGANASCGPHCCGVEERDEDE